MSRSILVVPLIVLAAVPLASEAQQVEAAPAPRFSVTPFAGFRVGYDFNYENRVVRDDGEVVFASENEVAAEGGGVFGVELDARVWRSVSAVATLGYDPSHTGELITVGTQGTTFSTVESGGAWFGKLGAALWLREPEPDFRLHKPIAALFAGIAARRVEEIDDPGIEGDGGSYFVWGVNAGFKGETPIVGALNFQFGAEDYWTFWNDDRPARQIEREFQEGGEVVVARVSTDPTHLIVVRAGISYRF